MKTVKLEIESLRAQLFACQLQDPRTSSDALIRLFGDAGLSICELNGSSVSDLSPWADSDGDVISPVTLLNPSLQSSKSSTLRGSGTLSASLLYSLKHIVISHNVDHPTAKKLDRYAESILDTFALLCDSMNCDYGWYDEKNERAADHQRKVLSTGRILHMCWCNYFGSSHLAKHGLDFFMSAPGWTKRPTARGILFVATSTFSEWISHKHSHVEICNYFELRYPRIKLFQTLETTS